MAAAVTAAASTPWSAGGSVRELELGDHLCHLFGGDEELLSVAADAVSGGLDRQQKVLVFAHRWGPEHVDRELAKLVPGWFRAVAGRQVEIHRSSDVYLPDGGFDPESRLHGLLGSAARAREGGYAGLRVVAEMGWAAAPVTGSELVYSYEAWLNPVVAAERMVVLCLYDRRLFDLSELSRASSVHPMTTGQAALRCRRQDDWSVELIGQVDATNHDALASVIAPLVDIEATVTIDATELFFADVSAARLLVTTAMARLAQPTVIKCVEPLTGLLRSMAGAGVPGLAIRDQAASEAGA